MKKILTILPSLTMGGAEHMTYELIKNLKKDTYEPIVICYGPKRDTSLESQMESVCEVKYMGISTSIGPIEMIQVMREISNNKPDLIHAHMGGVTFAIPWCRMHKKPLVLTVHTRPDRAFSKRNQEQIKKFFHSGRLTMVAVSEENYRLIQRYYGIKDKRIRFVNNGIDLDRFKKREHEGFAYINVARQDENKNQAAIIRCFNRLHDERSDTKLYLIGDGPCHQELVELVKELGLSDSVSIPGLSNTPEDYYAISDVYVQSSHREAMPLSVLEALASGLAIVSTNIGGLKDVVSENGFLVADNNEQELYEAMKKMALLPQNQLSSMMGISLQIANEYSSDYMARKYSEIYKDRI